MGEWGGGAFQLALRLQFVSVSDSSAFEHSFPLTFKESLCFFLASGYLLLQISIDLSLIPFHPRPSPPLFFSLLLLLLLNRLQPDITDGQGLVKKQF
jgi:hypothetical protein